MVAKQIILKVICSKVANSFVKKNHYSGKVVTNSQLHFGVFFKETLHGVLSFGPPLDKRKVLGIVKNTKWNEMIELNRMTLDSSLAKNSESRALSVAIRLIKKNAPHIRFVLSFADGMQCGDGTIYRAAGFKLTGISKGSMWLLPKELIPYNDGSPVANRLKVQDKYSALSKYVLSRTKGKNLSMSGYVEKFGGSILGGYMFRYVYLIDKSAELSVPEIPFSKIAEIGGKIYKGRRTAPSPSDGTSA